MWNSPCSASVTVGVEWAPAAMRVWDGRVSPPALRARAVPGAVGGLPLTAVEERACSSGGSPVSLDSTTPGCCQTVPSFSTQWERALHECPLFTWGDVKWMVKLLDRVRASITLTVRQRSSRVPSQAMQLSPASNTLSHLIKAVGTPALSTPACCSPSGSLLASLKWAGCYIMGAGLLMKQGLGSLKALAL